MLFAVINIPVLEFIDVCMHVECFKIARDRQTDNRQTENSSNEGLLLCRRSSPPTLTVMRTPECTEILTHHLHVGLYMFCLCACQMKMVCERELTLLDMAINCKKSCCIRIGPRMNISCANVCSSSSINIPWVSEIRYLGIYIGYCNHVHISVPCQPIEERFTAQRMLSSVKLVVLHQRKCN